MAIKLHFNDHFQHELVAVILRLRYQWALGTQVILLFHELAE